MLIATGTFSTRGLARRIVLLATATALACGAAVGRAADYQDANGNVCEGVDASFGSACFNATRSRTARQTTSRWAPA